MLEQLRRIQGNLNAEDVLLFEEDFLGGIDTALWSILNTLTGGQAGVAAAGGLRRLSTGITSLSDTKLSITPAFVRLDKDPILECRVRLAPTGSLANMIFEWGIGSSTTGAVFIYDAGASANWRTITRNGGTATTNTSTVAVAANTFVNMRIMLTSSNALFYINQTLVATHTTNLPSATSTHDLVAGYLRTTSLVNVVADIDFIRLREKREA